MANYVVSDTSLTAVADAIRLKGGTSAQLEFPDEFVDAIGDIQTGGGSAVVQPLSVTENGTYTAPSGVDGYSPVTVNVQGGETPVPDDGKTRIWIHIGEDTPENRLTFYLRFTASTANNTTVDWGDGTSEVKGSTTAINYSHTYAKGGNYIITLTVNSGEINLSGNSSYSIFGSASNYYNRLRIIKIVLGDNIGTIGAYTFRYCFSINDIIIPDGIPYIDSTAFSNCYSLMKVTLPDSVTSIATSAFTGCYSMSEFHLKSTTPPTLASSNAFTNVPTDCIFYVPYSADHSVLEAYKTATNWSSRASQMQEEPA